MQARQAQQALRATRTALKDLDGAQVSGARSSNVFAAGLEGSSRGLMKMGNQLQWTGRQLMYNWTLPIAAAATVATKWQLANEKAVTRVAKVYGDQKFTASAKGATRAKNEISALTRNFEALSNKYGVLQSEVINIGADWAAAGSSGLALAKSTELTLKTMVLGEMDYKKATKALISIQAQYGLSSQGLSDTIAQLNAVENQTGTSMDDLIEAFTRTAGVARDAGIGTGQLAAMIAAIVPAAGSAANGGNALKTIISRLLAPTKETVATLKLMGINVADTGWQSLTAAQRLQVLSDKYQKLTDGQKLAVSSTVASRWQLNKFNVLMKAMQPGQSYYNKALQIAGDKTQYLKIASQELSQVLDSNPQKIKQLGTILQNVAAKVIIPLIPTIIGLGNEIRKMADWFGNLDPRVQKLIGTTLLFIAVIGPIAKYIGSIGTLVGTLGLGLGKLGGGVLGLVGIFGRFGGALLTIPFVWLSKGLFGIVGIVGSVGGLLGSKLGLLVKPFSWFFGLIISRAIGFKYIFLGVFNTLIGALVWIPGRGMPRVAAAFMFGFRTVFAGLGTAIKAFGAAGVALFIKGWTKLPGLILLALRTLPAIIGGALISPIGLAITAIIGIILIFRKQLGTIFGRIGDFLLAPWKAAMGGLAGTAGFFQKFVGFLSNVFWSLPVQVQNAMLAVVKVVKSAALAVYHLFQYLNPFAHHSPSLVENVTKGMAVVVGQFNTLTKIKSPIDTAYDSISKLKQLTQSFSVSQDAKDNKGQIANLAKYAPQAVGVFKQLVAEQAKLQAQLDQMSGPIAKQQAVVDGLTNKLNEMNFALDQQQKILDRLQSQADKYSQAIDAANQSISDYTTAPLVGMKAMNEQIYQNDKAQKQLQLDMLKMKMAGQGYEDAASQAAKLNGALETLNGQREEVRQQGAGGDILGFYDQELKKINSQKKAVDDQAAQYKNLADQLQHLDDIGQQLDLEKSLGLDDMQHQLEQIANTQKEITFDDAVKGITAAQAEIAKYQPLLDGVNNQIKQQQQIVDQLADTIRPIQDEYDIQNHKLETMKAAYDQVNAVVSDISNALSDITSKTEKAATSAQKVGSGLKGKGAGGAMDSLPPAAQAFKDAGNANYASVGGNKNIGREGKAFDQSADIDKFTKKLQDDVGNMFGKIDLLAPIKKKWAAVKGWFSDNIKPAFGPIADGIKNLFSGIDWLAPFKKGDLGELVQGIKDTIKAIPDTLKKAWDFIKTVFGGDFKRLAVDTWKALKDAFADVKTALDPLFQSLKPLVPIIKGALIVGFVIFIGILKLVINLLSKILPPIIRLLGNIIKNIINIVRGLIDVFVGIMTLNPTKIWEGLAVIFKGIASMGWAIVKTIVAVIWGLLTSIMDTIMSVGAGIAGAIWGPDAPISKALTTARDGFAQWVDDVAAFFGSLWTKISDWVSKLYDKIVGWFLKIYDEIIGHSIIPDLINGIVDWFKKLPEWISSHLKGFYDKVVGWFNSLWTWVKDTFGPWWATVKYVLMHPLDAAKTAIGIVWDKVKGIFNDLWTWFSNTWIGKKWISLKDKLLQPLKDAKQYISDILTGKKSIKTVFEDAINVLGKVWDGLKDKTKGPLKFIIDTVMNNGFIRVFNDFGSHLPGKPHLPNIASFATGGNTGPGAKNTPAGVVHADEHVWTKAEVAKTPGGHKTLEKVRGAIMHGGWKRLKGLDGGDDPAAAMMKGMRGYAKGGAVLGASQSSKSSGSGDPLNRYQRALSWAKAQRGKPYVFGSAGPGGFDCSGFMGAIENILLGKPPNRRRWSTTAFGGNPKSAQGFTRNAKSAFMIGVNPAAGKSGHTAGTLLGHNVESSGGVGVRVDGGARGWNNGLFSWHGGFHGGADLTERFTGFFKGLKADFLKLEGHWPKGDDIMNQVGVRSGKELPPAMEQYANTLVKKAIDDFLRSIGMKQAGTASSIGGLSWVGEAGPELMKMPRGSKVHSNVKSGQVLAGSIEKTVTVAFSRAMDTATKPLEEAASRAVGRAITNATRRVASQDAGTTRETTSPTSTRTIVISEAVFPNVKSGDDAKEFIDNLVMVTSGIGGVQ